MSKTAKKLLQDAWNSGRLFFTRTSPSRWTTKVEGKSFLCVIGCIWGQILFLVIMDWIPFVKYDIKEQFSNFMEESPIVQYWDFAFESGPQGLVSVPTAYFCKTYPCMYILSEKMILVFTYRTYFCSVIYCTLCGQNVVGYCWFCVPSMRLLSLVVGVVIMLFMLLIL